VAKTVENFAKDVAPADTAGRLDAPAFHRNREAILSAFSRHLGNLSGDILEVGSGTGQHAATFAERFPDLTFWPSDPVADHVSSINAWAATTSAQNIKPATQLDCLQQPWSLAQAPIGERSLTALIAINVIHIAPWQVCEAIFAGAGTHLTNEGVLLLYGPYKKDGDHTSEGNAAFDAALRARNPQFGVRDLDEVTQCASNAQLLLVDEIPMPSNNLTLVFKRR
jgi:hypothetical protein